ncbi:MAG TPA: ATPase [Sphingomicrobium sp.]|nr:ATPase [Sphingomicrobium sp.]
MRYLLIAAGLMIAATPAQSNVVSAHDRGFEIRHEVVLTGSPAEAWARIGRIQSWWSKDHTYSGNSANLRLSLVPGGCFCESFPGGGGIEHLRVSYADPAKRAVLSGALGPLLYEAVAGTMDIELKAEAKATRVTVTYRAAGFARGNGTGLALAVDQVIGEQLARLAKLRH